MPTGQSSDTANRIRWRQRLADAYSSTAGRMAITVAIIAFLVFITLNNSGWYSNDQWFILANGRYVMEHGFPYQNPFSVWGGNFVMENWLWSVIIYWMWSIGGQVAIWCFCTSLLLICDGILMKLMSIIVPGSKPTVRILSMIAFHSFMIMTYQCRPSLATIALSMLSLSITASWIHDEHKGTMRLIAMPFIMLMAFNMHMAMAWYVILIPGCFMLPDAVFSLMTNESKKDSSIRPLIAYTVTVVSSILVTLLNPYGVNGVMFLFRSFGAASYRHTIFEMQPMVQCLSSSYCAKASGSAVVIMTMIVMAVSLVAMFSFRKRLPSVASNVMVIGCILVSSGLIAGAFVSIRIGYGLVMPLPLLLVIAATCIGGSDESFIPFLAAFTATVVLIASDNVPFPWPRNTSEASPNRVVAMVDRNVPKGAGLATYGNVGGKLVWNGYSVSSDMRPELLSSAVTGLDTDWNKLQTDAHFSIGEARLFVDKSVDDGIEWWVYPKGSYVSKVLSSDSRFSRVDSTSDGIVLYRTR